MHPGRSARSHLRALAATHHITASRVSEVIQMTGLAPVATKRVGGFSLGMGQRLGIAAGPVQQVIDSVTGATVRVRSPTPRRASLEEAYMNLTQDAVEYRAHTIPKGHRS